jgi:hypothetical protein
LRFAPAAGVSGHVLNGYPAQADADSGFAVFCGDIVGSDERSVLVELTCGPDAGRQQLTAVTLSYQQVAGEVAFHEKVAFVDIAREETLEPVPMDAIVSQHLAIRSPSKPGAAPPNLLGMAKRTPRSVSSTKRPTRRSGPGCLTTRARCGTTCC